MGNLRKPYLVREAGQWKFTFHHKKGNIRKTYLSITCESGIFGMRVAGNTDAFGYLLAAAMQDRLDQLEGYAMTMCIPAMTITQDVELNEDVQRAIMRHIDRVSGKGAEEAAKVTEAEETVSQTVMEDVAGYADAKSAKERAAIRGKWMQETRDTIGHEGV